MTHRNEEWCFNHEKFPIKFDKNVKSLCIDVDRGVIFFILFI